MTGASQIFQSNSGATGSGPNAGPPDGCTVEIVDGTSGLQGADLDWLTKHATAAIDQLGGHGQVRVRLVDDRTMVELHSRFSNDPSTTDVLTFDFAEPVAAGVPRPGLDVDIMACIDEARRQALVRGHELRRELLLYVVHGVLHCLGHDDHDDTAFDAMHRREDEILASIGVGPTFHTPDQRAVEPAPSSIGAGGENRGAM